ncbi:MAG: hypothetical protein II756_02450 [Clostridia bacterium]|nr:hypothetical protein [Clostridia bacterium]
MKTLKKLILAVTVLALMLALCTAVFASEGDTTTTGESAAAGDTATTGESATTGETDGASAEATAAPAATDPASAVADQVTYETVDGNGNPVRISGLAACSGGSAPLYIGHEYTINFKYYSTSRRETVDPGKVIIKSVESESDKVSFDGNTVHIAASDTPLTFKVTVEMPDGAEASGDFSVSRFNFSILELVIAFLGGYVIISALRGTGSLFTDEFIKEEKKASFKRIMRIMAIVCGLVLIASAVATVCFSYIDGINIVRYVCLGLAFVLLIGMAVINSLMTDKDKRDKAQQTARTGGPTNSSAAFEFDGSEPTLDEVLADIEKDKSSDKPEK